MARKKRSEKYHYYDRRKILIYLVLIFILGVVIFFLIFNNSRNNSAEDFMQTSDAVCSKADAERSFTYDACFDEATKYIIIDLKRNLYSQVSFSLLKISFDDGSKKSFDILDIPKAGELKTYDFESLVNPNSLDVLMEFNLFNSSIGCSFAKKVPVDLCSRASRPDFRDSTEDDSNSTGSLNDSRRIPLTISQKEDYWRDQCESIWDCKPYEECIDGIQRRDCTDLNNCAVPTDLPGFTRYCSAGNCVEDWSCDWSSCQNGESIPTCVDKNSCGTEFHKPSKVLCGFEDNICNPDIVCGNWGSCLLDYSTSNIEGTNFSGVKERICEDLNACIGKIRQTEECSLLVDIYTKTVNQCGREYIEVYNQLTGSRIAKITRGDGDNPYFNVYLGDDSKNSCDTCFNGLLDLDEEGIDCGGSCKSCSDFILPVKEDGFFERLKSFFGF